MSKALIHAALNAIEKTNVLLENKEVPFEAIYRQYKTLQSIWFRVIEDASETNSRKLEDVAMKLEETIQVCSIWIKENSPNNKEKKKEIEGKE